MIGPLRNASSSGDDSRACSSDTFEPSNVITVSNGAMVMMRSRRSHGQRAADAEIALRAKRGVQQLGFDARDLHAPVAELILVLDIESVAA